jgi:hypothetical protein
MSTPFSLQDHCKTLAKVGVTETPVIYLMENDKDPADRKWRRIGWDEGIRFNRDAAILIKMGDVETPSCE